ncbi:MULTISPECIES: isochorismate synthase MenF [Virgibacillus]|uniref:Isochorismate synthase MenF n=1 Tax=Virgibacillus dokdonensis TaxID=302167 RepID=A0A2K9J4E4_9BACI|nr:MULTISPECIES: isochorismate synthase [Virgibacillus]AUJ25913.1 Salicylate biosynthesis isochorismate synthase [Virgibacillus dokdonensis]NWO13335.1 isochorismate synthase [Virgibacillus sp.]
MIEVQGQQVEELLREAINQMGLKQRTQLVSITKRVEAQDPVLFFASAAKLNKERCFWMSTKDAFSIVGVGNVFEINANEDRFQYIEETWKKLLDDVWVYNPFKAPGTGLVTLGGLDFDPKKPRTDLWNDFPRLQFKIPEYILTKNNSDFYLTINIKVCKDDHPIQLLKAIEAVETKLFQTVKEQLDLPKIIHKKVIAPEQWKKTVQRAKQEIQQKQMDKIVLAREMRLTFSKQVDISQMLSDLIDKQSNSYIFAFEQSDKSCFVGATPERLVRIEKKELLSTCLAGTAPRGATVEEDQRIAATLFHDPKNREEHDFVVQMIKQGINKYCTDVQIPDIPVVYPLKNLQHLYTPVTGILKDGYTIFNVIKELHPTPALGGVPRDLSMTFIRNNERLDRGWYGAPVGWLDSNEYGEFAVAIRSALIQDDEASLFAGCGIVKDSDPEEEFAETEIKFSPMLTVLGGQA